MTPRIQRPRIGVVLSAGGLRGAAHLGVLRQLVRHEIPIDVMVGVSAGAIIAAYYAAVGFTIEQMIADAPAFRGRHIVMHGVTLRAHETLKPFLRRFCGVIPHRLAQLEAADFSALHHGVQQLGIVCHDTISDGACYFSSADPGGARVADVARASAAMPGVLPPKTMTVRDRVVRLVDGGLSDSLPVAFAKSPGLDATHLILSDCRFAVPSPPDADDHLVYLKPDLAGLRPLRGPRLALVQAVAQGEAAVTAEVIARIQRWLAPRAARAGGRLAEAVG